MKRNRNSIAAIGIKKVLLTCLIALSGSTLVAQKESKLVSVNWETPRTVQFGESVYTVPVISGQYLNGDRPNFTYRERFKGIGEYEVSINIRSTVKAPSEDVKYLSRRQISVGNLHYEGKVSNAGNERYIAFSLFPYVRKGGEIHRITEFDYSLSPKSDGNPGFVQKDFVANSALQPGSGVWYKISVTQDGIYKIDYNQLQSILNDIGVDINGVNPQHINIYGNGEGKLPEENSVYRTDDLAKNAIIVSGEADGSFDAGDYILFYGWGPHRNYASGTSSIWNDRNPYSDVSCYFININPSETPRRIQNASVPVGAVTHNVSSYSYHARYEKDLYSLISSGQRWYGELFDGSDLQQNFNFSVPNIDQTTSADFRVFMASNATSNPANTHSYAINGTLYITQSLPAGNSNYLRGSVLFSTNTPSSSMNVTMTVSRTSPNIIAYLDYIELNARRNLVMTGNQFNFRDLPSVGAGNVAQYAVSGINQSSGFVWDVTDRRVPELINGSFSGSNYVFSADADTIREFVAANGTTYLSVTPVGWVDYQNLHALPQADYLIVTHPSFITQANRLADLHRETGLSVHVVNADHIYNEFSSGMKDATAIRMFAKMFYDRGELTPETRPKYLLLFGDGTYDPKDRVPNNNNYLLTYQTPNSESYIYSVVTDDYFGLLDDSDGVFLNDMLDIGVGRLLISSNQIAKEQVDKIEHYMKNGSNLFSSEVSACNSESNGNTFGDWRLRFVQIADDEDYFVVNDVEPLSNYTKANHPEININKIYLDAYTQETTAGGERSPGAQEEIDRSIQRGTLVMNYVGHGGEVGVAQERLISIPQILGWTNIDRLPLFVSATCEFTRFDDPSRVSAGEWVSLNPTGGAIALMTTTRTVTYGDNSDVIEAFGQNVFSLNVNSESLAFGEIIRRTKNGALGNIGMRCFTLVGDPALKIAFPGPRVVTDSINGLDPAVELDTIRALSKVNVKGHVEAPDNTVLTSFNGVLEVSMYDKPKTLNTLGMGTDPASSVIPFELQKSILYRGKVSVVNGYFDFEFVVPKDIDYSVGFGKLSYYADDDQRDLSGYDDRFYIGEIDPNGLNDTKGPDVELYLNDNSFVNGGISDETPILIAKLFDENGINTVGNGIGHDLIAVLDGKTGDPIVLNEYYSADLDSYQSGEIRYNFSQLEPGAHTLELKVWDVNNNSSNARLDFIVQKKAELTLDHVLNYPNPFTTRTEFFFEHNQACTALEVQVQIFTISGRLVKTINEAVQCDGFRSKGIPWNGRDEYGDQLAKGVYVYRVKVKTPDGSSADKTEKLVILK